MNSAAHDSTDSTQHTSEGAQPAAPAEPQPSGQSVERSPGPDFPPPPTTGDEEVDKVLRQAMAARQASGSEQSDALAAVHEELRRILDSDRDG